MKNLKEKLSESRSNSPGIPSDFDNRKCIKKSSECFTEIIPESKNVDNTGNNGEISGCDNVGSGGNRAGSKSAGGNENSSNKISFAGHESDVMSYYDNFNLSSSVPSNLTFYKNIKKLYPHIKIPDNAAKATFGCLNPITYVIEDIVLQKKSMESEYCVMDIGGGAGFDLFLMKQIMPNSKFLNIDISRNLLKTGAGVFKSELGENVNGEGGKTLFVCGNLSKLPIKDNYCADYIISNAVLNLIGDKDELLAGMACLLKNDGSMVLCDISYEGGSARNDYALGKKISDGTYFAPTIINEEEYKKIILKNFNYCHILERHEINPGLKELEGMSFAVNAYLIKKNPPGEKTDIECVSCGEKLPVNIYQQVSPDDAPIFLAMIETGILNTAVCRKCQKIYTDFAPYYFSWPSKNIYYHVFPSSLKSRRKEFELQIKYLPGRENNPGLIFGYAEFKRLLDSKNLL